MNKLFKENDRDLIFFDLETTGTRISQDRIVQIAVIKRPKDGSEPIKKTALINPTVKIPKDASDVHGITNEMVEGQPTFKNVSKSLLNFFSDCDLAGYNIKGFDLPLLCEEFARCGIEFEWNKVRVIDVMFIYKKLFPRTLGECFKYYTGRELEGAHDAMADTLATSMIFDEMRKQHMDELGDTLNSMVSYYDDGENYLDLEGCFIAEDDCAYFGFGKHRGKPVASQPGYMDWIIEKGEFTTSTKNIAKKLKAKKGKLKNGML